MLWFKIYFWIGFTFYFLSILVMAHVPGSHDKYPTVRDNPVRTFILIALLWPYTLFIRKY